MNMTYNWGILGPGGIAGRFAGALREAGRGVYAVASRSLQRARAFGDEHGARVAYGSYDELIADKAVQIVYIATPNDSHYRYIMQCLQNGKHVLCEKAITLNVRELREADALAKKNGLILMEAMLLYHMPLYPVLREAVEDGLLGPVRMVNVTFGSVQPLEAQNRFFNKQLGGGALLDIGVYALSFARYFLSSQPEILATDMLLHETGIDEQSGIVLRNREGQTCCVTLAFRSKLPKCGIVSGERGYLLIDSFPTADRAVFTGTDATRKEFSAGDSKKGFVYEIEDMERAIEEKGESSMAYTLDVMDLMTQIRAKWGFAYPGE